MVRRNGDHLVAARGPNMCSQAFIPIGRVEQVEFGFSSVPNARNIECSWRSMAPGTLAA